MSYARRAGVGFATILIGASLLASPASADDGGRTVCTADVSGCGWNPDPCEGLYEFLTGYLGREPTVEEWDQGWTICGEGF
jgi:hypothetical protein